MTYVTQEAQISKSGNFSGDRQMTKKLIVLPLAHVRNHRRVMITVAINVQCCKSCFSASLVCPLLACSQNTVSVLFSTIIQCDSE